MLRTASAWLVALVIAASPVLAAPQAAPAPAAPAATRPMGLYMTFQTDLGNITCKLYEKEAPVTVRTMVGLAIGKMSYIDPRTKATTKKKFFDGLTFHRVIPEFMIQGGDPLGNGTGSPMGPGFPYKNETSPALMFDGPGKLAMANSGPDTNASQFFITEMAYPSLNGGYTLWGQCDDAGVEVVKKIARVKTGANDRPVTPVHIQHVIVERVGPAPANAPEAMPTLNAAPKPKAAAPATGGAKPATPATKAPATKPPATKPPATK
jgi:peptidyl-prolyl cis-trans isomerase A (cyclophilin A)